MTCRPSTALTKAWERSGSTSDAHQGRPDSTVEPRIRQTANPPGQLLVHVIPWGKLKQLLTVNKVAIGVASTAEGIGLREEVQACPIPKRLLPRRQARPEDAKLVALVVDKTDGMSQL